MKKNNAEWQMYFEEVNKGWDDIFKMLQNRIFAKDASEIRHYIDHNEAGIAWDYFDGTLYEYKTKITQSEYDKIEDLGKLMGVKPEQWLFLKNSIVSEEDLNKIEEIYKKWNDILNIFETRILDKDISEIRKYAIHNEFELSFKYFTHVLATCRTIINKDEYYKIEDLGKFMGVQPKEWLFLKDLIDSDENLKKFEETYKKWDAILNIFQNRILDNDIFEIKEYFAHNELELSFECFATTLTEYKTKISKSEYDKIVDLGKYMNLKAERWFCLQNLIVSDEISQRLKKIFKNWDELFKIFEHQISYKEIPKIQRHNAYNEFELSLKCLARELKSSFKDYNNGITQDEYNKIEDLGKSMELKPEHWIFLKDIIRKESKIIKIKTY